MTVAKPNQRLWRGASIAIVGLLATVPVTAWAGPTEFTIDAEAFDQGNVRVSHKGQRYANDHSCIWNAGDVPNWTEYVIEFPVVADYMLSALYAAAQSRPVEIRLDDQKVHVGFTGTTGSWETRSARWEEQCRLHIASGRHTVRLESRRAHAAYLCAAVRVVGTAARRLEVEPPAGARARSTDTAPPAADPRGGTAPALGRIDPKVVGRAIDDLERTFPGRYHAARYRKAIAEFQSTREGLLKSLAEGKPVEPSAIENLLDGVRSVLLANPLLDFDRVLVVRRSPANSTGFVPTNFLTQASIPVKDRENADNEIAVLSNLRGKPRLDRLYKPRGRPDPPRRAAGFRRRPHAVFQHRRQRPLGDLLRSAATAAGWRS